METQKVKPFAVSGDPSLKGKEGSGDCGVLGIDFACSEPISL